MIDQEIASTLSEAVIYIIVGGQLWVVICLIFLIIRSVLVPLRALTKAIVSNERD